MFTWFGRQSRIARRPDRSRAARWRSFPVILRAEPLEDRLLLSLAPKLLLDINPSASRCMQWRGFIGEAPCLTASRDTEQKGIISLSAERSCSRGRPRALL